MRTRIAMFLTTFAVAAAFIASGPAQAGIIVTVGKPAPEDASIKTKTASLPGYSTEKGTASSSPTTCSADGTKSGSGCTVKLDPNTGLPLDWKCTPIGGGLVYCEDPAAAGAAPGEGGGGYYDPDAYDDEGLDDGEEMQAFGCAGGGNATSGILGIVGAVGGLVMMVRARRR